MARREPDYLGKMIRTHPVRTVLFSAGPVLFGLFLCANSYVNGGSLLFAMLFLTVMTTFSTMATRYHLVSFRVSELSESIEWSE